MSKKPSKVQRLVRLNQFREELADGALRQAVATQTGAEAKHSEANADVDRIGEWKLRDGHGGGLDLGVYSAALELEQRAMSKAQELQAELQRCEQRTAQAQDALIGAMTATRVSERRDRRERHAAAESAEKRSFDQISDVWLNTRNKGHD